MVERKASPLKPRKGTAATPPDDVKPQQLVDLRADLPAPPEHPGFVGDAPDTTPNENYTLAGVLADLPVPVHYR